MLATWEVSPEEGKSVVITVERAPNGKDVIRTNGLVAAKPMAPGESEREISVGGYPYIVRRTGPDTFDLAYDELANARARTLETAQNILAHAATPLAATPSNASRLIPMIGWTVAILAVVGVLLYALPKSYDKRAAQRVSLLLREMKIGNNPDARMAIGLWARAPLKMDSQEMNAASDQYDRWLNEKDLYRKAFATYEIKSSTVIEGEKIPTAIVTFTIESTEYKVRVPSGKPISWED